VAALTTSTYRQPAPDSVAAFDPAVLDGAVIELHLTPDGELVGTVRILPHQD
jgi:hypothetical protein